MEKTFQARPGEVPRSWVLVDLENKTLGRAASQIARILRGKNKPEFTPHVDTGDFVVAINASKVRLTGRKMETKRYYAHSGYPGGLREDKVADLLQRKPEQVIRLAVSGMLPKTPLGRRLIKKLKVYGTDRHPHEAQRPSPVEI